MANVQHIYSGNGDPNSIFDLHLQGDAVGVHLYMDTQNGDVWMSKFFISEGVKTHAEWSMVTLTDPER